jgi:hypothetical protein
MFSGINDLFYPMTADIYYATQEQNDFGEIIKTWERDRSVNCSAIKQNPNSRTPNYVNPSTNLEYDIVINFRTNEDIQISSQDEDYKVTDILITNIKDANGNVIWKEDRNSPTVFEIRAIEPMMDILSNIMGYRIHCVRTETQEL